MKQIIRFFLKLAYTLYGLIKILAGTKFRAKKKILNANSEPYYILGNGPSLKNDISRFDLNLKSDNLMVVNDFAITELYTELKPEFYILADPAYYVENLKPNLQIIAQNLFVALHEKTNWPLSIFVPYEGLKKIQEKLKENEHITVLGYNKVNTWKGFKWFDRWMYHKQWAIISGLNVIMVALSLSISMGIKKIYLLGVDHDWFKNLVVGDDNLLYILDTHFYDDDNLKPVPLSIERNNQ
ncbi:MAG: DUF115 domain-containing protein, partial [Tannerella sp.]|nr:DUF115 domain-containing protein [Tannerella sp.]